MSPYDEYWRNQSYYKYLFHSQKFVEVVKSNWKECKGAVVACLNYMTNLSDRIYYSQMDNFEKWPILDQYLGGTLIVCGGWENEIGYVNHWMNTRIGWFDSYITNI